LRVDAVENVESVEREQSDAFFDDKGEPVGRFSGWAVA
jgi:hypothetical protein